MKVKVRYLARATHFTSLDTVQTDSVAHVVFCTMGVGANSPGVKLPGRKADHSPPSSADVENGGVVSNCKYVFIAWCLIN
jgi:hypothetical protein